MFVVAVAASRPHMPPAVGFDKTDHVSNLHILILCPATSSSGGTAQRPSSPCCRAWLEPARGRLCPAPQWRAKPAIRIDFIGALAAIEVEVAFHALHVGAADEIFRGRVRGGMTHEGNCIKDRNGGGASAGPSTQGRWSSSVEFLQSPDVSGDGSANVALSLLQRFPGARVFLFHSLPQVRLGRIVTP